MHLTESGEASPLYDAIGRGYRRYRRPDPRLTAAIERALGMPHRW